MAGHSIGGRVQFATPAEAWAFYTIGERQLPDGKEQLAWAGLGPSADEQARVVAARERRSARALGRKVAAAWRFMNE